jgi:hypothetical protein
VKAIIILPLVLAIGFAGMAQTGKPKSKTIYNNKLLALATRELSVKNLRQQYRQNLSIKKVSVNQHDSSVKDTLLVANTGTDNLQIFTNEYNSFLVSAHFKSSRISFGNGIKMGASQVSFCKAYGLSPGFDIYQIIETPEGGFDISFRFSQGKLSEVIYTVNHFD